MIPDTYAIYKGNKIMGYLTAYSSYHALMSAKALYGSETWVERISATNQSPVKT